MKERIKKLKTGISETAVSDILERIGISPAYTGFHYLKSAIFLALSDDTYLKALTKRLYPDVAKRYNTDWHRTERCMRYAIVKGWNEMINVDLRLRNKIFENIGGRSKAYPAIGQFIVCVIEYLKIN